MAERQTRGGSLMDDYFVSHGSHATASEGRCAMEWVSYLAGERHSDQPACVSPVLRRYCIALNDRLGDDDRQKLRPYLARMARLSRGAAPQGDREQGADRAPAAGLVAAHGRARDVVVIARIEIVMQEVRECGPITAADIADNTGLTERVVRNCLAHLESAGRIESDKYQRRARVYLPVDE